MTSRPPSDEDPHRENEALRQENEALRRRLAEAEQVNEALTKGQIDAVVDEAHQVPLLLSEAQEALRASEEKYRTIVMTADEGIWTADASRVVTFANERMASMLGYTVQETIGRITRDFVDASAWEEALQGFERRRQGVRERRDLPLRRKDGTVLWASVTFSPLMGPDGRFAGSLGMVTDITDRKRAEQELRESQASLEQAQAVAHMGSWVRDALNEGERIWWSKETMRIFGVEPAEFDGRVETFFERVHPEDRDYVWEESAAARRERRPYSLDHRIVRSDGSIRWVHESAEVTRDAAGQPLKMIGIVQDITESRRAAELLRESEERYRVLFDESPLPMWLSDQETLAIAAVNEAAVRHYGYSREECLSKTMREIWHPDEVAAATARLAESSGDPWSGVRRHFKKGGASITVEVFSHTVQLLGRRYRLSAIRDITDRRLTEEQVERIHSEYRLLLNSIGEGVHWIGVDGRIRFENPAAAGMLGYEVSELIGKPAHLTMHHTRADGTPYPVDECVIYAALRGGVARHAKDDVFWRKDGTSFAVEYVSTPIRDEKDRPAGTVVVFTDITDRRRLEEQLLQSQKMEAVGRLAGGVAHDFNNLLTVIFGYSDVLLHGLEPGPLYEAMQEVWRASERAAGLTRQLLAFSRKQTLVPEVLDLGDVVSSLSTMVERLIGEDVKVSVVVSPGLGWVKADRGQLEQVVMNLTVNARDAMPKGGSLLLELQNVELDDAYTATHAEVKPGPYVLLAISDTGTGMDAKTQKRIFEPFFTTKEAGKGTGLGLSTVHGIVHQSGGAIDVYSKPGRGTTFKVYLPRFADDAAVPRAVSEIHAALAAESETVLVVEDEAAIGQLTKLILQKAGYTVLLAESPVAAERIAGSHPGPIHLMLADVVMPGMRGPKLAEQLIRLRPDLRVLYMSGYTDNAIAHHGILDAGTEFLQKPFTPLRLRQKIREVLGRSER